MKQNLFFLVIFFLFCIFDVHQSTKIQPISEKTHLFQNTSLKWRRRRSPVLLLDKNMKPNVPFVVSGILTFISAAISSAGGTGGGGLYISILTIVAGIDLKTASGFSAFMVTGASVANVVYYMFSSRKGENSLINYDIALLAQPLVLLGVSFGVLCNLMLPEWLITILFMSFLGFCTYKTLKSGIKHWKRETDMNSRLNNEVESSCGNLVIPLLAIEMVETKESETSSFQKLCILVVIWFSILGFISHNRWKSWTRTYSYSSMWNSILDHIFTSNSSSMSFYSMDLVSFTSRSLLQFAVGYLGGVFGIGGGMLVSPLLLQMGLEPVMTAATCSFMVFFSSTMSSIQYFMFGMKQVESALIYSGICLSASVIGLTLIQRAIMKHGRASLVVFSVSLVLVLSTLMMAGYGVVNTWTDYITGQYMGFKKPC